ncbi:5-carboxymethyl-2-hydroxymuconate isomerase [Burkholderia contaminans]|uniref:5-carboxymethyl-2-hydroxymuconate isomerase n=1 Tax=Burkholderia contaminans TaxID=488447 RepID=A0A0G3Z6R1_9BURK|nr:MULTISPECIES: fumarylacetoacetate hydrolase family protein [Burkholderia]AKM45272.1 5-carboxymethyl-2-hydroxymuconate isomerase [Burkholderia contaminans]AOL08516.1 5-carboxymethyl-2-hydroxymuconate isomerase [Burkholderia contaminans]ELK6462067.1 fumarylacetoacetate hydrolase family protein [Burkholderia contaminans]RQT07894.1 5-carboxymethyl-2-hydroxymuconate isomerase [Burkholderia contaminans]RQT11571.1 5-carboxymethyl-2-hydroxymuconate isomerase [Burkholderia contaminans]
MRLAMFREGGTDRIGVVEADTIIDVTAGLPALSTELADWLPGLATSWRMLALLARESTARLPLSAVRLLPPVRRPSTFLAIGGNYASHIREIAHLNVSVGEHQIWFNKQVSCITGPFDELIVPAGMSTLDYEVELAVIIGRRCRNVSARDAVHCIAGYTVCNDASIRERHSRSPTITLAKSFDSLGPLGPWMVTADEIPDPHVLQVRTWVNGELRQDGNTAEMRFNIFEQIEELSSAMTLEPGDVLATGTPAGIGAARQPPLFLSPGDVVRMQIEGIGEIENRVSDALPART